MTYRKELKRKENTVGPWEWEDEENKQRTLDEFEEDEK